MVRKGWKNAAIFTAVSLMLLPTFQAYAVTARPNTNGSFVEEGGNWSFKSPEGEKLGGWVVSNNEWYYLDPQSGNLRSGWLKSEDGKTYFLYTVHDGNFGKAVNGWNWIDGYCYYFESADNAENGILKTGGRTADGYLVDSAGRWVNESTGQPVYEAGKGLPSSDSDQKVAGIDRPISGGSVSGRSASGARISSGRGGRNSSGSAGSSNSSGSAGSSNSSGSGSSNSANENNNANNENNNANNENNNANNENSSVEKSILNTEKTKAVHTELGDFVSVVFSEGSLSDYDVYIDGTDVSKALTKVDDEGKILKWISTVASPKKLELKKKGSEELVQTISLNEGTAVDAIDAGNPEDAPKYLLTRGRISKYDYYLSPKDKEGQERIYPTSTTFDLEETRKENSKNVSTSYYVKPLLIDAYGNSVNGEPLVAKFSLSGEEQKKWFSGIDKLSLLRYEDYTKLNPDLSFESGMESAKYGTNGVIKVYSGQSNMINHGLYLLNIHSSYSEESVTIPVELVKAAKFNLVLQAQSNNAKQGERVGFDVVGENGATFGNDLKVDNMMVTLIKPDGTSHELSYIHDFFNFTNYFILYGTGGADGKTVNTDQAGRYKLKIRYAGYQEMVKEFTIHPGKAVNLEDSDQEKAERAAARKKSTGSGSSGKKTDAVSAATSGSIGKKKKTDKKSITKADSVSSATGGGSSHIDGRVIFNYDLLSNALLLNELEMLNSDALAVVKTYYSMTIDDSSYLYNEGADAFYSYRDYLNENADRKAAGEKLLSFKEFTENVGKKDYHGPSQVLNVLENGRLGGLTDFKLVKGKQTPSFSGTSTDIGGEFTLKTEDTAYLAAIKGVYVDRQTANLLDNTYTKPIVINKEEGTILVKRDAFNFWLTPEILPHTLRISAEGYRDLKLKLQFKEKEDGLQFSVEGEAESKKDVVLSLGTSDDAKKALANVIAVRIKKPKEGELKTVLDGVTGGKTKNDYYVIDKENGTITLKAGLFKEAGEYKYEIKIKNRTKRLSGTIVVKEAPETPSAPNEETDQENIKEGHPKMASLVAVTDKDKNQSYRTLAFEGLDRNELHTYLQNISVVTVNGTEYEKAFSSIRIGEKQYFAVGNGYGYKNQLRLDKASLVEGKNTVVIENSDGTEDRFVVELSSDKKENESSGNKDNSASNAKKKSSGLEVKEIVKVENYTGAVESYAVLFKGKEEDVKSALSKIETVSLNEKTLEKASSFIGGVGNFPEDKYAIKDYIGAYGGEVSLQLPAKAFQDGSNKLSVKLSDGTSFTLNFDKDGNILKEEAPAGKKFAIESIKKKSSLFGSSLQVKFKDMDQNAMRAFKETVKSITLNEKTLEKETSISSKTGKYYFTLISGAYSGVDHLILSPEDAKEKVNTLTIDAEGYEILTVKFDQDGKLLFD